MAEKETSVNDLRELKSLIHGVKRDNLQQFGEVKKEFGAISKTLEDHHGRIRNLERDKIERDAVERFRREGDGAGSQKVYTSEGFNLNSDLLRLIKALGLVIAALAAAIIGTKL